MDEEHDQQLMRESKLKSGTSGSETRAFPPYSVMLWLLDYTQGQFMGPRAPQFPVSFSVLQMSSGSPLMFFHFT